MSNYRTLSEVTEDYLRQHPDEIDDYIVELFDEYAEGGSAAALMSSLQIVSRVKGVTDIAETSDLSRKGLQKALSGNGDPRFSSVNAILEMDYRLVPQKLPSPLRQEVERYVQPLD